MHQPRAASASLSCVQSQYNKTKQGISQSVEAVRPPRHLKEGTGGRAELGAVERDIFHIQDVGAGLLSCCFPAVKLRKEVHHRASGIQMQAEGVPLS